MASAVLLLIPALETAALALVGVVWLVWAISAAYLLVLVLAAALGRQAAAAVPDRQRRFCILIPAHNEEMLLGPVLDGLSALDYPAGARQVVVVADNCTDGTAPLARAHGAEVLERTDPAQRGKGYALDWALRRLLADAGPFDAFLILDADSVLSPNFLSAMNAGLARGQEVIQGRYDVLNTDEGWRTRLMACALALAHYVRPLGRMRLGLSDGLKGNGMCFSRGVLERVPWSGESITEDIEYTLRLVEAGVRVHFAPEAVVRAQMPTTGSQAATQRERWEGGRYALMRRALRLLGRAARLRRPMMADRAIELIIPPFVEMVAVTLVFLLGAAAWAYRAPGSGAPHILLWAWGVVLAAEIAYLALGLVVARAPWTVASALVFAPFYMVWKLAVVAALVLRRGAGGWKRTERHSLEPTGSAWRPDDRTSG